MTEEYFKQKVTRLKAEIAFNERIHCHYVAARLKRELYELERKYREGKDNE